MEKPASYCEYVNTLEKENLHKIYHDSQYGFPILSDNELSLLEEGPTAMAPCHASEAALSRDVHVNSGAMKSFSLSSLSSARFEVDIVQNSFMETRVDPPDLEV